jgi:hypothetical protein
MTEFFLECLSGHELYPSNGRTVKSFSERALRMKAEFLPDWNLVYSYGNILGVEELRWRQVFSEGLCNERQ